MLANFSIIPALVAALQIPLAAELQPERGISSSTSASVTVLRAVRIDRSDLRNVTGQQTQISRDGAGTLWIEFR